MRGRAGVPVEVADRRAATDGDPSDGRRPADRLPYLPGLDGLRAVAVGAVFLFHAGVVDGGFIGVDVFFVVSGFLITSIALAEVDTTGRLALGRFWARRVRRLYPALAALTAAVAAYSFAQGGRVLERMPGDVISTLLYFANWFQVGEDRDYFATYDSPPLLEHAWSLAVEEQFYIVWPLVIAGLALVSSRRAPTRCTTRHLVGALAVLVAATSFASAMWLRSRGAGIGRLYYGTDTRAVALAVGAAVGSIRGVVARIARVPGRIRDVSAGLGVAAFVVFATILDGSQRWLYGPGFLLVALLSVALIAGCVDGTAFVRVMSSRPLVAIGKVSYGVYLWHWPVIVVFSSERTGLSGPLLGSLWVSTTALLTVLSWMLVERRAPLPRLASWRTGAAYACSLTLLLGVAVAGADLSRRRQDTVDYAVPEAPPLAASSRVGAPVSAPPRPTPPSVPVDVVDASSDTGSGPGDAPTAPLPTTGPSDTQRPTPEPLGAEEAVVAPTPTPIATIPWPTDDPLRVAIVGDSVALSLSSADQRSQRLDLDDTRSVEILNLAQIACPVIQEGEWWLSDGSTLRAPDQCRGDDRFADDLAAFAPDVVYVLFGWPGGGGRRLDDGSIVQPCEPGFDQRWARDLEQLATRIDRDFPVVISTVAPPQLDPSEQDGVTDCLNRAVAGIELPTFDYARWLCPDNDCSVSSTLRSDGIHFDNVDRLQVDVMRILLDQLVEIAGY
ncbi:MAG: acyltransferase family protein [Ilumatobacter sp.]|uniref:acyltransferase family protein n=3 Tax=Ilumatobacter sp. TaxID=1967498 RepID=UPI003299D11B